MNPSALSAAVLQRGGTIPTICACCGVTFQARSVLAAYCNANCRIRAHYYRRNGRPIPPKGAVIRTQPIRTQVVQPEILPAQPAGLEVRQWNGTPIERRPDGYVNATAMCKANGKRWAKFRESAQCEAYMPALAAEDRISVFDLVVSQRGGTGAGGSTWIHPDLATELARWISPAFSVFVNRWFRSVVEAAQQPQPVPIPALPSPITAERIQAVLATCDPITTNAVLNAIGLPCSRSNQMAVGSVLRGMGYQHSRVRVDGSLTWVYQPATQPKPLPEGIHVVAATQRRAAELWWEAIESEVHGALARRLNPRHRTDDGLPLVVGYQWQQLSLIGR
jgi:hypothetical protein